MLIADSRLLIAKEGRPSTMGELTDYRWDAKATALGIERPLKQNDHGADALRYAVSTLWSSICALSISSSNAEITKKLRLY